MTFLSLYRSKKGDIVVISLTELGMVIDFILAHLNESSPIIVTFLPLYSDGIITSVSFLDIF